MERIGSMHIKPDIKLWLFAALLLMWHSAVRAQSPKDSLTPVPPVKEVKYKSTLFSVGLTSVNYYMRLDQDTNIRNPQVLKAGTMVQFGYGGLTKRGYWNTSLDLVSGPYNTTVRDGVAIDLSGRALSAVAGFTVDGSDIRGGNGNFGLAIGLNWYDVKGNLIGVNEIVADRLTFDSFIVRLTGYCVTPSLFYALFKEEPRREGNAPELLATRVEGYVVNFGVALPLSLRYKMTYTATASDGSMAVITRGGYTSGYALFLAITAHMGV